VERLLGLERVLGLERLLGLERQLGVELGVVGRRGLLELGQRLDLERLTCTRVRPRSPCPRLGETRTS
jgi:hypothetical protein